LEELTEPPDSQAGFREKGRERTKGRRWERGRGRGRGQGKRSGRGTGGMERKRDGLGKGYLLHGMKLRGIDGPACVNPIADRFDSIDCTKWRMP